MVDEQQHHVEQHPTFSFTPEQMQSYFSNINNNFSMTVPNVESLQCTKQTEDTNEDDIEREFEKEIYLEEVGSSTARAFFISFVF